MPEINIVQDTPKASEPQPEVKKDDAASASAPTSASASPPSPERHTRQDVAYKLPDGRTLKMGKPPVPTHLLLPDLASSYNELAKGKADAISLRLNLNFATMVAFVRGIDNEPFGVPHSAGEVMYIMTKLGEDGCDAVSEIYAHNFAPLTMEQLEVVKK